ncbi:MAG: hypothetical protein FH753_15460 [Firmicutes bacterium]|nr:hypothetical protein [Bacillota bacterium]
MGNIDKELKKIVDSGFKLSNDDYELESLAFVSLRLALKSYFSTYKSMEISISPLVKDYKDSQGNDMYSEEQLNWSHTRDYYENYCETIIHFQHFFELITKDILEKINKLLVVKVHGRYDILYKLITNESLGREEEKLNTIEFSQVLTAFSQLNKKGIIDDKYKFLAKNENIKVLKKLNNLRNRTWHRGLYVLPYKKLDNFIGKFVLPLANKIARKPDYKKYERKWKYEYIACGIDPLSEIINLYDSINEVFDEKILKKTAYLKELGRASYNNSIKKEEWKSKDYKKRNKAICHTSMAYFYKKKFDSKSKVALNTARVNKQEGECYYNYIQDYTCPVCGLKTLIEYIDHLDEDDMDYKCSYYEWTEEVNCSCCGFGVHNSLGNAKELELELDSYFNE